MMEDSEAF